MLRFVGMYHYTPTLGNYFNLHNCPIKIIIPKLRVRWRISSLRPPGVGSKTLSKKKKKKKKENE
jgi:hypothetical protein